jgi:hypothetical protein
MDHPSPHDDLSPELLDLLFKAWTAHTAMGGGIVVTDETYPAAHRLAEAGWLTMCIEDDGEFSWHWSHMAEQALRAGALITDSKDRRN